MVCCHLSSALLARSRGHPAHRLITGQQKKKGHLLGCKRPSPGELGGRSVSAVAAEAVVHTELDGVELLLDTRRVIRESDKEKVLRPKVDVVVFDLGRPVRHDEVLKACTEEPTHPL